MVDRAVSLLASSIRYIRLCFFSGEFLALLARLFDAADHVEGPFRQVVVLAFAEAAESLDGVGEFDELARRARENFRDVEGLRQETLDLAGARPRQVVLFGT